MYAFFYPETGKRARATTYESAQDAKAIYRNAPSWDEVLSTGDKDLTAFMNSVTGDILVLREIVEQGKL